MGFGLNLRNALSPTDRLLAPSNCQQFVEHLVSILFEHCVDPTYLLRARSCLPLYFIETAVLGHELVPLLFKRVAFWLVREDLHIVGEPAGRVPVCYHFAAGQWATLEHVPLVYGVGL